MTLTAIEPPSHLGFLTIVQSDGGTLGGYLVTNLWGRPLEFRLSSAIQPNKVQQILYGPTLGVFLSAELIGKTLVEKTTTSVQFILTDHRDALDLRRHLNVPVAWVAPAGDSEAGQLAAGGLSLRESGPNRGPVLAHPDFPDDVPSGVELFKRLGPNMDLAEPFVRIREAIGEARKLGVAQRAAG